MRAYERLIRYAKVHTASSEDLSRTPSTGRQFDLSRMLAEEMRALGMEDVFIDELGRAPYSLLNACTKA